jgi:TRAP-type C4-dicarboxylate transport system permease small subunit
VAEVTPGADAPGLVRRALDLLYLGTGVLAAASLCFICVLMLLQVLFRELSLTLRGADDLSAWGCAAASFLALAYTFKQGDLIRMGLCLERLSPDRRRIAEIAALIVATLFSAYLSWWLLQTILEHIEFHDMAQGLLVIPIWIPKSLALLGSTVLLVAVVDELVIVLRGRTPTYVVVEERRLAARDFSERV